jgi:hypothetical protein
VTVTQAAGSANGVSSPEGLLVSSIAGASVTLRWSPPTGGPEPSAYVLAGGLAPGTTAGVIAIDGRQRLVTLALPSGAFFLRLHAVTGGVQSPPSNEVLAVVNVPVPPSAPSGLVGLVHGASVVLAWRNTFAGGAPTGAMLDVSGAITGTIPLPAGESASFDAVPPGTYAVALRAANAAGTSAPSNTVTLAVPSPCSGPPATPANVLAYAVGRTLSIVWDPAATGPAPTGYLVLVGGAFDGAFPTLARSLGGAVGPGTYSLRVLAANPCGQSAPSAAQLVLVS